MLFIPTMSVRCVIDITINMLNEMNSRGIILDVDETLAEHGSQEAFAGVDVWIRNLERNGKKIIIVSNNFRDRVEPFAAGLNLPFITVGLKPFPIGLLRAARKIGCKVKETTVVGDQIFTDILGANLCGMTSILVEPVSDALSFTMKLKRKLEIPIRSKIARRRSKEDNLYKS